MNSPGFPFASQASQLRAYQKDHLFVQTISQELRDIFALFPQGQALQRNEDFLTFLSQSIYFFTTTGSGLKTLGEEYCDLWRILPNQNDSWRLPTKSDRAKLFVIQIALPFLYQRAKRVRRPRQKMLFYLWKWFNLASKMEKFSAAVVKVNWTLWCFTGVYLPVYFRLMRIRFISATKERVPRIQYSFLGLLCLIELLIRSAFFMKVCIRKLFTSKIETSSPSNEGNDHVDPSGATAPTCALCLEPRKDPTATSCGHVFCWHCAAESISKKPTCPVCRQTVNVQELLRLQQYL